MRPAVSPFLTDLYQLNMVEAYLARGTTETAVFEFFVRRLPEKRNFVMAAGLEQVLLFLEDLRFTPDDIAWLASTGRFTPRLLDYLAGFRFTGDIHAVPEGTVVFGNEPILRVTAPLPAAQFVETRLMNLVHFQTLIASKAARSVLVASGRLLVDFGFRRAHGAEAGLLAARASYIAGFAGTATVEAERSFGIRTFGTMAHSFIEAHDNEADAFLDFARARPEGLTFLIDTYDTERAARTVVRIAPKLQAAGIRIGAVRIDSGDLGVLSRRVRRILDDGGLDTVTIFVSGGLDEHDVAALLADGAPIDGFGVGTSLTTSDDLPALDCAYKLQEYAGVPRRKLSPGKATWPGRKQIWRRYDGSGKMAGDTLSVADDDQPGTPLLTPVMVGGARVGPAPTLHEIRAHAAKELGSLPEPLRRLEKAEPYPVAIGERLAGLAAEADRRIASMGVNP
ncbi:MAG TPA: nicotinate phosphoribosyltransferase [Bauldia sp.]|nr:nicotinate phosphoribosyltransferase [Bauldia sp.]